MTVEEINSALDKETLKYLKDNNLIDALCDLLNLDTLITIDLSDVKEILKGSKLVAHINQKFNMNDNIILDIDQNLNVKAILSITANKNVSLSTIDQIIRKFKNNFKTADIIYGCSTDNSLKDDEYILFSLITEKLFENDEDKELLYDVAKFLVLGGTPSLNTIQCEFSLGFNRACRIMEKLESKGIVTAKNGTEPRRVIVAKVETLDKLIK